MRRCGPGGDGHQAPPEKKDFSGRLNLPFADLRQQLVSASGRLFYYVIASIEQRSGLLVQTATAPNWQGGACSLCTCKARMRTCHDAAAWPGVWVAGFTGLKAGGGRNYLVYLMRVGNAFRSHADCWHSPVLSDATKAAKAAHRNKFGDLFVPCSTPGGPFDPASYLPPRSGHDHADGCDCREASARWHPVWHHDVRRYRNGRAAALLVGDPARTYIWDRPVLFLPGSIGIGERNTGLRQVLDRLDAGTVLPRG
jgi:hypothetical protein